MDKNLNSFILLTLLFLFGYLFVTGCSCNFNLGFYEGLCNGKEHFTVKETSRKNFNF